MSIIALLNKVLLSLLVVLSSSSVFAQGTPPPPANPPKTESPTGVYSGREVYVPEVKEQKAEESSATRFSDGFLRNTRHHVGFSLFVSDSYTPGVLVAADNKRGVSMRSVVPQLYLNSQTKHAAFRVTYGAS